MSNYKHNKRWRKKYPDRWRKSKHQYHKQFKAGAHNSNQAWPTGDENLVLLHGIPDRNIAKQIGRTVRAIQAKRGRLRKIFKNENNLL